MMKKIIIVLTLFAAIAITVTSFILGDDITGLTAQQAAAKGFCFGCLAMIGIFAAFWAALKIDD
jgi:membrane associated rhomboid family serine protease